MKRKGVNITVVSPGLVSTPMIADMGETDLYKTMMSPMKPERVARIALAKLGKKPLVVPGKKNNVMVFMMKYLSSVRTAIRMNGWMIEKASKPSLLAN